MSRTRIQPGDGNPRHGTPNGYANGGCRCQSCRDAWREYQRVCRERRRDPLVLAAAFVSHGSRSTYVGYGCRCGACRAANAAYMSRYRSAR
jgi:hypothetical protein